MNLTGVLNAFRTGTYTVTRQPRATFNTSGDPVLASPSTFSVSASKQPAAGRDLQRLPEGLRVNEVLAFYTSTLLTNGDVTYEPDVISIDGNSYQVATVERWNDIGGYWKALVSKVGNG